MREEQVFGLNQRAMNWLEQHGLKEPIKKCPKCGEVLETGVISTIYRREEDSDICLHEYQTDIGPVLEVEQASVWSSGPCIFYALEKDGERIPGTEWNEGEMNV